MKKTLMSLVLIGFVSAASAGDYDIGRDSNTRNGTLGEGTVREGTVIQVRNVQIEPTGTAKNTGRAIGAVVGAGVGSQMSKNRYFTGALGGLLGGVGGDIAADTIASSTAQEIIILREDGKSTTITQAQSDLRAGQKVYLVQSAGKIRVITKHDD